MNWATNWGGASGDEALAVAVSATGHVYTAGYFIGTLQVTTSEGSQTLVCNGVTDILITCHAPDGSFEWARAIGGPEEDRGLAIAVDPQGNVLVTGFFIFNVDFDPGPGVVNFNSPLYQDVFILKLDANGQFLWAGQLECQDCQGNSIATDANGRVIVGGMFTYDADLDPGAGEVLVSDPGTDAGFICVLNAAGSYQWSAVLSNTTNYGSNEISALTVDASNAIYATGSFYSIFDLSLTDFDPGPGTAQLGALQQADGFVMKLDPNGTFQWVRHLSGSGQETPKAVAVSVQGAVIIGGEFDGDMDADPGAAQQMLTGDGASDGFVLTLDASGNYVRHAQLTAFEAQHVNGLALSSAGDLWVIGSFAGTVDFDPGPTTALRTSFSSQPDVFLWKLDANGNYEWVTSFGTTLEDRGRGIAADAQGRILTCGTLPAIATLGNPPNEVTLTSNGGFDAFLARWSDGATGITENASLPLSAAPNPFWNMVQLQWDGGNEPAYLEVLDLTGRTILTTRASSPATIEVPGPAGTYIARIRTAQDAHRTLRLIKEQ